VRAVALDVHRDFCGVAVVPEGRLRSAGRSAHGLRRWSWFIPVLKRRGQAAVSRCGSFQPGRAKWQL
jgi:hypothetical protein